MNWPAVRSRSIKTHVQKKDTPQLVEINSKSKVGININSLFSILKSHSESNSFFSEGSGVGFLLL